MAKKIKIKIGMKLALRKDWKRTYRITKIDHKCGLITLKENSSKQTECITAFGDLWKIFTRRAIPGFRNTAEYEAAAKKAHVIVKEFWNAAEDTIGNLASRWEDESAYEDINDYQVVLAKLGEEHGVKVVGMVKRPFGCKFTVCGFDALTWKITMSATSYKYGLV